MTRRAVVIIGPMGAGKTSIGRRAAKALHVPFFDTDIAVVRAHGPIPQIFALQGEPRFRELEREAVREALTTEGIVAVGGGAVLHPQTRADLAHHPVLLLTVEARTVAARIRGASRPLLQGDDALQAWQRVADERGRLYAGLADATVDTSAGHFRDLVERVATWAQQQWDADEPPAAGQEGTE